MAIKQIFQTKISESWTQADDPGDALGDLRWQDNKCYKCVQFNNGSGNVASIAGLAAYYYAVAGNPLATGYDANTVTMDRTDGYGTAAGIFQGVVADGDRCWVQIKGFALGNSALLNAGANDGLAITETGAGVDGELDVSALVTDVVVGYVIDESAFTIICDFPF